MILNAEKALVGCLINFPEQAADCDSIRADMFSDPFLADVFQELQRAHDFGYSCSLVELRGKFPDMPEQEFIDRISSCSTSPDVPAAGRYAKMVFQKHTERRIREAIARTDFTSVDVAEKTGRLISQLEEILGDGPKVSKSISQIAAELEGKYFRERESSPVQTGLQRLDDCLGGLEKGDVCVIGARPAVGKSAFAAQILCSMAEQGKRVVLYSLEMSEPQLYERFIARKSGIDLTRIRRAQAFLGDEEQKFKAANAELKKLDIWISAGPKTVSQIRSECRHMKADCIVIDYLQLIRSERHFTNRASEVGEISKGIKAIAMELGCPIILLSQLNRLSEGKQTKEPTMSELRESGDIEQDASTILLLWNRDEQDFGRKCLKVAKNRQGTLATIGLEFSGAEMVFRESDEIELTPFKPTNNTPFFERGKYGQ